MSVDVTRLPSGLTVVTDAMPHLQTASLGVWVGSGSRDEQPGRARHLASARAHGLQGHDAPRTARQIAEEIEAVGGDLNAATSVETTAYYARVLKADVPLALDVLSDILSDPAFDPDELEREQNVIVQEIGAAEDTPDDLVFDRLQATAFPGQPVGRSILGTPETVRSFDSARIRTYLSRNYRAPDMVVAAAGAVDHEAVVAEVERRFASFAGPGGADAGAGAVPRRRQCREAQARAGPHRDGAGRRAAARSGALQPAGVHQRARRRHVVAPVPGGAREARPVLRDLTRSTCPIPTPGMFGLYAGTDAADADELMRVVVDEIAAAADTINEAEIARAKAQMKAGLLMALESSSARAEQLARQMIAYGRPIPLDEIVAKVEAVTMESARAAGRALIGRSRPAIAILGPSRRLESTAAIAESLAPGGVITYIRHGRARAVLA